jgi:hypothetical protein
MGLSQKIIEKISYFFLSGNFFIGSLGKMVKFDWLKFSPPYKWSQNLV